MRREWTTEEVTYLQDKWGTYSIKAIANHLGRSINSIKLKARRIGLSDPTLHFDGITICQLAQALNLQYSIVKNWIKNYDLPAKRKVFAKEQRVWVITYKEFWNWAESNRQMIDFSRFEKNVLGEEPSWVLQ